MKIAMMTNNYKPFVGGVPISIERLTDALRRQGHEVVIFAPTYEEQKEEDGIVRYPSLCRGFTEGFVMPNPIDRNIMQIFAREQFDIIHVHHPVAVGQAAVFLSKKYGIPLVFTYHTRYEQYLHYIRPYAFLEKRAKKAAMPGNWADRLAAVCRERLIPAYIRAYAKQCDMIFAPTVQMKEHLQQTGVAAPIAVLPTGLTEDSFRPDEKEAERIRKQYGGGKKYVFCTIARLAKEKNLSFLLRSMYCLKERYGNQFQLLLIGKGNEEYTLREEAKRLNLEENIVFAGEISNTEVKNYCHAADLFLFSSKTETQGIVLLEAMAAQTPVAAVRATGVADMIANGSNGYMTEEDEKQFADMIWHMVSEREQHQYMKEYAYETAKEYMGAKIAERAAAYYEAALSACGSANSKNNPYTYTTFPI